MNQFQSKVVSQACSPWWMSWHLHRKRCKERNPLLCMASGTSENGKHSICTKYHVEFQ